jgi:hypothetical protein
LTLFSRVYQTSLSVLFGRFPGSSVLAPTIFEDGDVRNKTKKKAWLPEVTKPKAQALERRGATESQ